MFPLGFAPGVRTTLAINASFERLFPVSGINLVEQVEDF